MSQHPQFEAVALPHLDAAYNLAWWLMRERPAAEDVVQEALLRALTYFSSYQGGNARAWLLQIVRNVAYGQLQGRRNMQLQSLDSEDPAVDAAVLADTSTNPEAGLLRERDLRQLQSLLAELPVELRECLVLRELEDLSYRDIAQITGIPVGTVMSRLWRARQLLLKAAEGATAP